MIKKFEQFNEGIKHLLVGPTREELLSDPTIAFSAGFQENDYDMVEYALKTKKLDINKVNDILYFCIEDNNISLIELILKYYNVNDIDIDGELEHAKNFNRSEIIKILKKYKNLINESLLLEKSTLPMLGVPTNVMKSIQKDLALSDDAQWEKIPTKSLVADFLRKGGRNLFIQISVTSIKVITSYPTIKGTEFFVDKYRFIDDDWGGEFRKTTREYKSYTQTMIEVRPNSNIYKLIGNFSIHQQSRRKMIRKEIEFSEFHDIFVKEFLQRFDGILKRITGKGFENAKGEIKEKAKQIAIENKMLIQGLDNPLQGPNGLSILDEFLLKFEESYSEYFGEPITIQELVGLFSRDKVMTMLMYFIYRGKIIN